VGMVTRVAPIAALLALTLAACGGSGTKSSSPTTSSSPSTASDLQQAGAAYQKTLSIIDSASFANLGKARDAGDGAAMLGAASNYRNVVFTWDAAVRAISFPSAVQPQVNTVLEANRTEIAALDAAGRLAATNAAGIATDVSQAIVDDDAGFQASNALQQALGQPTATPLPPAEVAYDRYQLATDTFNLDYSSPSSQYSTAANNKDLAGSQAATRAENAVLQSWIDQVGKIPFPAFAQADAGAWKAAANALLAFDSRRLTAVSFAQLTALGTNNAVFQALNGANQKLLSDLTSSASPSSTTSPGG